MLQVGNKSFWRFRNPEALLHWGAYALVLAQESTERTISESRRSAGLHPQAGVLSRKSTTPELAGSRVVSLTAACDFAAMESSV